MNKINFSLFFLFSFVFFINSSHSIEIKRHGIDLGIKFIVDSNEASTGHATLTSPGKAKFNFDNFQLDITTLVLNEDPKNLIESNIKIYDSSSKLRLQCKLVSQSGKRGECQSSTVSDILKLQQKIKLELVATI
ncbi:MAG: hypothetical protein HQK51_16135 [Oligoflexia bacterium]|nr:hypothetical protein [Oligoflexia bacterium]